MIERGAVFFGGEKGVLTAKRRPLLVVQNDEVNDLHTTVVVCLISATLTGRHSFRVPVAPSAANGLDRASEVQVDRLFSLQRESLEKRLGTLDREDFERVESALKLWLAL